MSNVVFATTTASLAHAGQRIRINGGEVWSADDPLVAQYPDFFTEAPRAVRTTRDPRGWTEYEQATDAPGEKRSTVRPDKARALERAQRLGVEVDARWSAAKIDLACDEHEAQQAVE